MEREVDYASLAWNMFSSRNWIRISKPLLHILGDRETIMLGQMVSRAHYSPDPSTKAFSNWFPATASYLFQHTAQSSDTQLRTIKSLIQSGVLEKILKGIPAKNYYRINYKILIELLEMDFPDTVKVRNKLRTTQNQVSQLPEKSVTGYRESPQLLYKDSPTTKDYSKDKTFYDPPDNTTQSIPFHSNGENLSHRRKGRTTPVPVPKEPEPPVEPVKEKDPILVEGRRLLPGFTKLYKDLNQAPYPKAKTFPIMRELGLMVTDDRLDPERILGLMSWLSSNFNKPYVPTVSTVYQFRNKFFDLEKAKYRIEHPQNGNGNCNPMKVVATEGMKEHIKQRMRKPGKVFVESPDGTMRPKYPEE